MPKLARAYWAIKIKAAHKVHLAESDDNFGGPVSVTLCGKKYDPANRRSATKDNQFNATAPMCEGCLKKVGYVNPERRRERDVLGIIQLLVDLQVSPEHYQETFAALVKERDKNAALRESRTGD